MVLFDRRKEAVAVPEHWLEHPSIRKCRHHIIAPEHYRTDGTCKCNDPHETAMRESGYRWDRKRKLWVLPNEVRHG